jgi:flagellin-specific chaperone FliS
MISNGRRESARGLKHHVQPLFALALIIEFEIHDLAEFLNPDAGASVARNLGRFYSMIRERLLEAQVRSSREILEELRTQMLDIRQAG